MYFAKGLNIFTLDPNLKEKLIMGETQMNVMQALGYIENIEKWFTKIENENWTEYEME